MNARLKQIYFGVNFNNLFVIFALIFFFLFRVFAAYFCDLPLYLSRFNRTEETETALGKKTIWQRKRKREIIAACHIVNLK